VEPDPVVKEQELSEVEEVQTVEGRVMDLAPDQGVTAYARHVALE
jgi:hypothetical protein